MRRSRTATCLALLLGIVSCGSSSTTPTTPAPPPAPPPAVEFTPETFLISPNSVALELGDFSEADRTATLHVDANLAEDLYGYGVDLVFDTELLEFASVEGADFLTEGDATVETEVREKPEGRLIIGQTRVGDVEGVDGNGTMLRITFELLDTGEAALSFEDGDTFNSDGTRTRGEFIGGTLTIRELEEDGE